jgi:hypothetical protein
MNKFEKIKFVSIGGSNDTGDGSFELPYKTIQYAMSQVEIGELGWRVVLMSGSYYEPNLDLLPNIPLQAMIPNTVTITSPIIFAYNGSYSFDGITPFITDNYAFTCTNNLSININFTDCNLTAIPTTDAGCGIFNINNATFNISIVDSLLSIQNYQELVSIINTTTNSNGVISLNDCELKAIKNNQIQLDAPILLLNGNTKVIVENSKIYGQIQIENNASINANKTNLKTNQFPIIVTNSSTTSRLTHCDIDCETNPVIDGLGTLQVAECCFLNNGTRFSTTLNNNTGIYYLPTTSPRLVDQALPQSIQSGALYYAQGDFYDDRTSRFKIPQADQETGVLTPEQLPDAQYGEKGINYLISNRKGALKQSFIDIEAGVNMELDDSTGVVVFNATGSLANKILVELADGTTEAVSKLKQGSNMDWVIDGETVTQSATGGSGKSYEIGDGLQTTLNPDTGKEILSTKADANEFAYDESGKTILLDSYIKNIAQDNFDTNIIPIQQEINAIKNTIIPISQQLYLLQLKVDVIQDWLGINTTLLLGASFQDKTDGQIFNDIYTAIPSNGTNLTIVFANTDIINFDIPFTKESFGALGNLYDVAEYIQTYCQANQEYPLSMFLCSWDSSHQQFVMTTASNEIIIYTKCPNDNIMGTAMLLTQNTNADLEYMDSFVNDGTIYARVINAQETADTTNTELTDNNTIYKANNATQELSSSDDSVEITYTGRNADLKTKGGSGMNTNIGYKQYKWNNLVSADYNISVIDEQLIPVSSIKNVTIKEVQYSNKINFSITSLTKSQLIGNNQYYAFIGLINTEESLPKNSYYQGAVASSLAVIQQAVATDPFIWIYWKYQGQTISYNITLTPSNVATIDALLTRVNTAIKQQYPYMSSFEFNYGVRTNKFYMQVNNPDVTFTTEGISQGGYDTNLACGVCVQSLSSSVLVLNGASTGVGGLPNISNNKVWVSDQFLLTDTATLTNFTVETDYFSFTADFSKLTNDAIASALFANNIALISVESNNATELENTLFYPNRSAQNFAGSPYFPISFIKSSVLLDQDTITYSPIVLAIYNGKDYAENIDKIVSITIDLSRYPINQKEFSQFINFQFNSVLIPAEHFVQLIVNASNTDYTINGLKVYTSPLVKVLNYNEEKNVDGNITKVSDKIFMLKCNQNDIAVFAPSSDVSSSAVTGLAVWDSNKAYAINDIVSMQSDTDMGVFICVVSNTGDNPWLTNSWLPYGGINTYHLTNTTYQVSSGVNMVMVSAPENEDVVLELPQMSQIKDTWSCTFKACKLTNGNKIFIYGFHDISGHDVFENGSDVIEMINASDILTVYIRNGDNKIYYSLG